LGPQQNIGENFSASPIKSHTPSIQGSISQQIEPTGTLATDLGKNAKPYDAFLNAKKREEEKRSKEQTYPASAGIRLKSDQNQTPM